MALQAKLIAVCSSVKFQEESGGWSGREWKVLEQLLVAAVVYPSMGNVDCNLCSTCSEFQQTTTEGVKETMPFIAHSLFNAEMSARNNILPR